MSSISNSDEIYGMLGNYLSLVEYLHPITEENDSIIADSVRSQSMALYFTAKKINIFMSHWRPEDYLGNYIQMSWGIFFQSLDKIDENKRIVFFLNQLKYGLNQKSISNPDYSRLPDFFRNTGLQIVPSEKEFTTDVEIHSNEIEEISQLFNQFLSVCLFAPNSAIRANVIKDVCMLLSRKPGRELIKNVVKSMEKHKIPVLFFAEGNAFYFHFNRSNKFSVSILYSLKVMLGKVFDISNNPNPFLITLYDPFNFISLSHELTHFLNYLEDEAGLDKRVNSPSLDYRYNNEEEELAILVENRILESFRLPQRKFHCPGISPDDDLNRTIRLIGQLNLAGDRARLMHQGVGELTDPQLLYETYCIINSLDIPYIPPLRLPKILQ